VRDVIFFGSLCDTRVCNSSLNSRLAGHANHRQKIHLHEMIKQENLTLKMQNHHQRSEIRRLQTQLDTAAVDAEGAQTPAAQRPQSRRVPLSARSYNRGPAKEGAKEGGKHKPKRDPATRLLLKTPGARGTQQNKKRPSKRAKANTKAKSTDKAAVGRRLQALREEARAKGVVLAPLSANKVYQLK
jgi:hypothetical protein